MKTSIELTDYVLFITFGDVTQGTINSLCRWVREKTKGLEFFRLAMDFTKSTYVADFAPFINMVNSLPVLVTYTAGMRDGPMRFSASFTGVPSNKFFTKKSAMMQAIKEYMPEILIQTKAGICRFVKSDKAVLFEVINMNGGIVWKEVSNHFHEIPSNRFVADIRNWDSPVRSALISGFNGMTDRQFFLVGARPREIPIKAHITATMDPEVLKNETGFEFVI